MPHYFSYAIGLEIRGNTRQVLASLVSYSFKTATWCRRWELDGRPCLAGSTKSHNPVDGMWEGISLGREIINKEIFQSVESGKS